MGKNRKGAQSVRGGVGDVDEALYKSKSWQTTTIDKIY
jgi:hypothetical protein